MVMQQRFEALTEKERQTLRLMAQGHDAKSLARHLDLSVHTINERLRDARRKLGVSSSREAARLLRQQEQVAYEKVGDRRFGGAPVEPSNPQSYEQTAATSSGTRRLGGPTMLIALSALSLALVRSDSPAPAAPQASASSADLKAEVSSAALRWLALVDAQDWQASFAATGDQFRSLNTVQGWTDASQSARVPLGAVVTRDVVAQEYVPAPPAGYELVRLRTTFANKANTTETVSLVREGGGWKVVGYIIN